MRCPSRAPSSSSKSGKIMVTAYAPSQTLPSHPVRRAAALIADAVRQEWRSAWDGQADRARMTPCVGDVSDPPAQVRSGSATDAAVIRTPFHDEGCPSTTRFPRSVPERRVRRGGDQPAPRHEGGEVDKGELLALIGDRRGDDPGPGDALLLSRWRSVLGQADRVLPPR